MSIFRGGPITIPEILAWADAYRARMGRWGGIDNVLRQGNRGLPGGMSLSRLLLEQRGVPQGSALARLTVEQILCWADAHHERTGEWPHRRLTDPIPEAPLENWKTIHCALRDGWRGLPGKMTLFQFLSQHRDVAGSRRRPELTVIKILSWADAHFQRTSAWPNVKSGPVPEAPQENWRNLDKCLRHGRRGLKTHSSIPNFLAEHGRGKATPGHRRQLAAVLRGLE